MLRLAIASQKGGVGKTTISLNLAVAFAQKGYRTVLVDTDPQGAINLALGKGNSEFPGVLELLSGKLALSAALIQTHLPNLKLLPKGRLAMSQVPSYERLLFSQDPKQQLTRGLAAEADIAIFDTAAGLGMMTRAILRLATHVMVPFKVDHLNLRSVHQVLQVIDAVRQAENPQLQFLGLLMNMFERDKEQAFRIAGEVWSDFPCVLDTTIPKSDVFAQCMEQGIPLALLSRKPHPEARRFTALAEEVLALARAEEDSREESGIRQLI